MAYSPERKAAVLEMMLRPDGLSLRQLSQVEGISMSTLRRWRAEARAKGQLSPVRQSSAVHGYGDNYAIVVEPAGSLATGRTTAKVYECVDQQDDKLLDAGNVLSKQAEPTVTEHEPNTFNGLVEESDTQAEQHCSTAYSGSSPRRSILKVIWRYALASIAIAVLGVTALFGYVLWDLRGKGLLRIPDREPGIMVLASDGSMLALEGAFYGDEVRLNALPDYIPNAVVAIEDRRFRNHPGFDPIGVLRAALVNYQAGRVVQGGSTITQQLVKNLFLTPDRNMTRKLQEIVLAVWLELNYTKEEILELYLNRVYFGAGAFGIEKAAQIYFGKPAKELSIAEAAMLAGVLRAPRNYNPLGSRDAAERRAALVIESMREAGFISSEEAYQAVIKPAEASPPDDNTPGSRYFVEWVKDELAGLIPNYRQSLIVETTLDPKLQSAAESSVTTHLTSADPVMHAGQGALVLMDRHGAVRAMVGGRSYRDSQFNRATEAKRQPGSAFKPFVYLAALEQGYGPEWVETDEPVRVGNWKPENYNRENRGAVTLETAMALSLNTIAAKLIMAVGVEKVAATAKLLGIHSQLTSTPSLALGTSEVSLLEMTGAFASFANGGYAVEPFAVTRIRTRDGRTLYERTSKSNDPVISPRAVAGMNRMLRAVVERGTGKKAKFGSFEIAGKTGTSQDYRDAWFIGYTANLVAGVWIGNDDNTATAKITGGSVPADVWRDVMSVAHRNVPPTPLPGSEDPKELIAEMNDEAAGEEAALAIVGQEAARQVLANTDQRPHSAVIQKKRKSQRGYDTDLKRVSRSAKVSTKKEQSWGKRKRHGSMAFQASRPTMLVRQQKQSSQKCKRRFLFQSRCERVANSGR